MFILSIKYRRRYLVLWLNRNHAGFSLEHNLVSKTEMKPLLYFSEYLCWKIYQLLAYVSHLYFLSL